MSSTPRNLSQLARIKRLEDRLRRLETRRSLPRSSIGSGGLEIQDGGVIAIRGGRVESYDVAGNLVAEIGTLAGGDPDDVGIRLTRTDDPHAGSVAMRFLGGFIGFKDAAGYNIVSDDITAGRGLGTPWVPLDRPADTNIATWPATTNTAWTGIASCFVQKQNPGFRWSVLCQADGGTTGRFRIVINGSVVATSPAVSGTFAWWEAEYFWPDEWFLNDRPALDIEAQVTAGAGTIRAQIYQLTGRSSA